MLCGPFSTRRERLILCLKLLACFPPRRVKRDALHRAHLLALGFVEMPDAFGAFFWIDFVDFQTHVNRAVRAFGLAHVAINTFIGNHESHRSTVLPALGQFRVQALGDRGRYEAFNVAVHSCDFTDQGA